MPNTERPDAQVFVVAAAGDISAALTQYAGVNARPRAVTLNHRFNPDMEQNYAKMKVQLAGFRPGVDYILIGGRAAINFTTGMLLAHLLQGMTVDILQYDTRNRDGYLCDTVTFPSFGSEGAEFKGSSVFDNFIQADAPYLNTEEPRISFDN